MNGTSSEPTGGTASDPHRDHPAGCACCSGADACARAERQLRNLAELAEIELAMARLVRAEAEASPKPAAPDAEKSRPAVPNPHAALALRFARSIRQTYALEAKLAKEHREWASGVEAERAARRATARREKLMMHKARTIVALQAADEAQAISMEDCAAVVEALEERLTHETEFPGLIDQPTGEIVTSICQDYEIAFEWDRWAGEPAAVVAAAALLRRSATGHDPPPAPG